MRLSLAAALAILLVEGALADTPAAALCVEDPALQPAPNPPENAEVLLEAARNSPYAEYLDASVEEIWLLNSEGEPLLCVAGRNDNGCEFAHTFVFEADAVKYMASTESCSK